MTKLALLIGAHPDDIDFVCGGTVAEFIADGWRVSYLIVTDGGAGETPDGTESDLATRRRNEQMTAAQTLGVNHVYFGDHRDGLLQCNATIRRTITAVIRQTRPDLVITHAPERNYKSIRFSHPDHMAVGQATLAAVYPDARNRASFPDLSEQGLEPHVVPEVWLYGHETPNHAVQIQKSIEKKLTAISCHGSQLSSFGDYRTFFREWASELAEEVGQPDTMVEVYKALDTQ